MAQDKTRIPVIVGTGQVTDTTSKPEDARSPLQLMVEGRIVKESTS